MRKEFPQKKKKKEKTEEVASKAAGVASTDFGQAATVAGMTIHMLPSSASGNERSCGVTSMQVAIVYVYLALTIKSVSDCLCVLRACGYIYS